MAFLFYTSKPDSYIDIENVLVDDINIEYLRGIIESWKLQFPESKPNPNIDFEDWVENAVRLHEATVQYPDIPIYTHNDLTLFHKGVEVLPSEAPSEIFYLGSHSINDEDLAEKYKMKPLNEIGRSYFRYWDSEAFQLHCQRKIKKASASFYHGEDGLMAIIQSFKDEGYEEVFIKNAISKYDNPVRVSTSATLEDSDELTGLGWATVHLEGDKEAFIVQEVIDMRYEYRFIVVDGEVVAGAACVEEFTPLNNQGEAFDTQLRKVRRPASMVGTGPTCEALVDRMHNCAESFAKLARNDDCMPLNYTVDVAVNKFGTPLVIECNPLKNYGLYAMDYARILKAQVESYKLDSVHHKATANKL